MRPQPALRSGALQVPVGPSGREPRGTRAQSESEIGRADLSAGAAGCGGGAGAKLPAGAGTPAWRSTPLGWLCLGRRERGSSRWSQDGEGPPPTLGCIRREGSVQKSLSTVAF